MRSLIDKFVHHGGTETRSKTRQDGKTIAQIPFFSIFAIWNIFVVFLRVSVPPW